MTFTRSARSCRSATMDELSSRVVPCSIPSQVCVSSSAPPRGDDLKETIYTLQATLYMLYLSLGKKCRATFPPRGDTVVRSIGSIEAGVVSAAGSTLKLRESIERNSLKSNMARF